VALIHEVTAVDLRGILLTGELQSAIEEDRSRSLSLSVRRPQVPGSGATDARIAGIVSELEALKHLPSTHLPQNSPFADSLFPGQFRAKWATYQAARDSDIARASQPDATAQFSSAEALVAQARSDYAGQMTAHLGLVSQSLSAARMEVLGVVAVKILVLSLFLGLDWLRIRATRKLSRVKLALKSSETRFQQAYETVGVGMSLLSPEGEFYSVNRAAAEIFGYAPEELVGRKYADLVAPEFREPVIRAFADLAHLPASNYQAERKIIRKDGSSAWVRNSVTLLQRDTEEMYVFGVSEDITLQKEAHDRLAYLANFDPVTGLPNLHGFEEEFKRSLASVAQTTECIALIYIEIDGFDFLKGTFGRVVADEVLGELGECLYGFRRPGEFVGRLDDCVFGMFLKAAPFDENTLERAAQLRSVFHHSSVSGKHRIPLSPSIGVAYSTDATGPSGSRPRRSLEENADALLKFARAAMLEARSRGGDSIYVADPALEQRALERHQVETALLHGLRENEFSVVFQPQFKVSTGKLIRFEALCRWNSADLGSVAPDRFIPVAEQTGLISEIGKRVIQAALAQGKRWTDAGRRIGLAVNISPLQFMRPDFVQSIKEVLERSQFPPALLELEITEGIFIRDLNLAVARIRELQRLGLTVALDDFGTGYSSLSYLQRMPIDAVKLDRSFISDLTSDPATVSMMRSVLAMADALNLRVVCEGVETEHQFDILRSLGCEEAQGYLLGRPESPELALRRAIESQGLSLIKTTASAERAGVLVSARNTQA
jgi:PAS domain S-box-containing protein/diguanylate cyclase (GGDEF)-like protein